MAVLVKFSKDWADEFDVEGFKIYDDEDAWLADRDGLEEHSFMFGTNEGWEEGEFDDTDFTVTEISVDEAMTLRRLFGDAWGHFPF